MDFERLLTKLVLIWQFSMLSISFSARFFKFYQILKNIKCQILLIKKTQIKCSGGNQIRRMCINQKCKQKSIAYCSYNQCKCKKQHEYCSLSGEIQRVINCIREKIHDTTEIKEFLNQKFDTIIDEISNLREKILIDIDQKIRFSSLHRFQKDFYKKITKNQNLPQSFDSISAAQLWNVITFTDQYKNSLIDRMKNLLKTMEEETNSSLKKLNEEVEKNIQKEYVLKNIRLRHLEKERKRKLTEDQLKMIDSLVKQSSICKTRELSQRLIRFFSKRLKSLDLLYKASQNKFSMSKYYENCGAATNTIILCLSNKNKIVGFHTPFAFYEEGMKQDMWVQDQNSQSFIFSLTNNDKLTLRQDKSAFHRKNNSGFIQIGYGDITIRDKANKQNYNDLGCNSYYVNQKFYIYKDKESLVRFNGNQTQKCSLNQWEVWKVKFQPDNKMEENKK